VPAVGFCRFPISRSCRISSFEPGFIELGLEIPDGHQSKRLLVRVAGACGASVLGSVAGLHPKALFANEAYSANPLPPPDQSGVNHIVVVTMENRSFDHFSDGSPAPMASRPVCLILIPTGFAFNLSAGAGLHGLSASRP